MSPLEDLSGLIPKEAIIPAAHSASGPIAIVNRLDQAGLPNFAPYRPFYDENENPPPGPMPEGGFCLHLRSRLLRLSRNA